jgi:hypothetical protein
MTKRIAHTIAEVRAEGGGGKTQTYKAINSGLLRAVKRGRSTIVLDEDLREYLAKLPAITPRKKSLK